MIKYISFILLLAVMPASAALTTAPRRGPEGNRFLFVVDTSKSMKRLDQAGRQTVFDLVYSGLEDRMQPGDTFGVWTFGDEVKGGVFPVQVWAPERNADAAAQVTRFLKEQATAKSSRLDGAITNVERLVKSVKDVEIVIVTSAATRLKLDDSWALLQQAWKERSEEARKNNKPMIVCIAARGGQIMQANVTVGNEALKLMPPPPRRVAPVARAPEFEPPAKPAREPIIMQGTSKRKAVESIPTKFAPPPRQQQPEAPADPLATPAPEPSPVPVLAPDKPIVSDGRTLTVAAREPGSAGGAAQSPAGVSARMLIIAGASLMLIAGVLGIWMLIYVRSRKRISYISRSLTTEKPQP